MSSYDHTLLDEAPRATRAQRQEGYNVDLLEQPSRRRSSARSLPLPLPPVPFTQTSLEAGSGEKFGSTLYTSTAPTSRTSFWRSRKGVVTAVVIALIVIGAVVGGAVGGTAKKGSNNSVATGGIQPASSSNPSTPFNSDGSTSNSQSESGVTAESTSPLTATGTTYTSLSVVVETASPTASQATDSQNTQRVATISAGASLLFGPF